MLQEGVDSRTLTKGDYKAGQELVREAQANYDYTVKQQQTRQELVSKLQQTADLKAQQQAQQILESQTPQANVDKIVQQAKVNTTDLYIEGANGQFEINPNYKTPEINTTDMCIEGADGQFEMNFDYKVPKTTPKTTTPASTTSAPEAEILKRSQAQFDAQQNVNASWGRKPSAQDTEAFASWKTQHEELEGVLKTAEQALQELF